MPRHGRYHPFVYLPDEGRLWLPAAMLEPERDEGWELDRAVFWLELALPLVDRQPDLQAAFESLLDDLNQDQPLETSLTAWFECCRRQRLLPSILDPVSLLLLFAERQLTPPAELLQLIVEELEFLQDHGSAAALSRLGDEPLAAAEEVDLFCRRFVVLERERLHKMYQERPSWIPLLGTLVLQPDEGEDYLLALNTLVEEQFRHGHELRLSQGSAAESEEGVLEAFELQEEAICEGALEAFQQAESCWAAWLGQLPVMGVQPQQLGGDLSGFEHPASHLDFWLCPLCRTLNSPGQGRCGLCLLAPIIDKRPSDDFRKLSRSLR